MPPEIYRYLTVELPFRTEKEYNAFIHALGDYNTYNGERVTEQRAIIAMVTDYEPMRKELVQTRKNYNMQKQAYTDLANRYTRVLEQLEKITKDNQPKARRA